MFYSEIGEGCESKKTKIPVMCAHAYAREERCFNILKVVSDVCSFCYLELVEESV